MNRKLWSGDFLILLFGNFFVSIAFYFLITALPLYLVDGLQFSKSDAGLIISIYILTAVLSRLFAGPMLDAFGRKTIYLSSLLLFAITFLGYPFIMSYWGLISLRILHGISWGLLTTAGNTIAMDLLPDSRRGEGIGYYGLAFTFAMAMGPLLASVIVENSNFDLLFIVSTAIAIFGMLLIFFVHFPKTSEIKKFNVKSIYQIYAPVTFLFVFLTFIIMVPYGAILNFITLFCVKYYNGYSSIFFLSLALGLTISRVIAGKIFDKKGHYILLIVSFSSIILAIPMLVYFQSLFSLSLSALILGIGYGISFPVLQLMINSLMPIDKRGVANSIFLTALDVGIATGTVLLGFLSDNLGLVYSFMFFIIFPIVGIVIFQIKHAKKYN